MVNAIVFDCDGVLADTERYGHLPAFNQMFEELGIPAHWSEAEYGERLKIGGGKERLASLFTPEFIRTTGLPEDPAARAAVVAAWHARKTEIYGEMVRSGAVAARPGIARIIREALDAGWRLAVASTSAEASVRAILEQVAGADASRFEAVLAGDIVPRKKPAPDIYCLAINRLAISPARILVVEDSGNGVDAAAAAGLTSIATINDYTVDDDVSAAALVVDSLGDPGGPVTTVIADRRGSSVGQYAVLEDLERCLPT